MADQAKGKLRWGRWLFGIVLVLIFAAYCALWFLTKPMIESFADNWVEEQKRAGYDIQYSERRVEGFPFNFKLVFEDPVVIAPGQQARWQGEQIRLHSRPWNFYPMLANWWGEVESYVPGKSIVRDQNGEVHELNLSPASRLIVSWSDEGLTNANLKLEGLTATIDGENFDTDDFVLDVTPSDNLAGAFDINLSWDSITVPRPWLAEARAGLQDAPPAIAGIAAGILNGLETGTAANIPMPNALALGDQPMLFGMPLN